MPAQRTEKTQTAKKTTLDVVSLEEDDPLQEIECAKLAELYASEDPALLWPELTTEEKNSVLAARQARYTKYVEETKLLDDAGKPFQSLFKCTYPGCGKEQKPGTKKNDANRHTNTHFPENKIKCRYRNCSYAGAHQSSNLAAHVLAAHRGRGGSKKAGKSPQKHATTSKKDRKSRQKHASTSTATSNTSVDQYPGGPNANYAFNNAQTTPMTIASTPGSCHSSFSSLFSASGSPYSNLSSSVPSTAFTTPADSTTNLPTPESSPAFSNIRIFCPNCQVFNICICEDISQLSLANFASSHDDAVLPPIEAPFSFSQLSAPSSPARVVQGLNALQLTNVHSAASSPAPVVRVFPVHPSASLVLARGDNSNDMYPGPGDGIVRPSATSPPAAVPQGLGNMPNASQVKNVADVGYFSYTHPAVGTRSYQSSGISPAPSVAGQRNASQLQNMAAYFDYVGVVDGISPPLAASSQLAASQGPVHPGDALPMQSDPAIETYDHLSPAGNGPHLSALSAPLTAVAPHAFAQSPTTSQLQNVSAAENTCSAFLSPTTGTLFLSASSFPAATIQGPAQVPNTTHVQDANALFHAMYSQTAMQMSQNELIQTNVLASATVFSPTQAPVAPSAQNYMTVAPSQLQMQPAQTAPVLQNSNAYAHEQLTVAPWQLHANASDLPPAGNVYAQNHTTVARWQVALPQVAAPMAQPGPMQAPDAVPPSNPVSQNEFDGASWQRAVEQALMMPQPGSSQEANTVPFASAASQNQFVSGPWQRTLGKAAPLAQADVAQMSTTGIPPANMFAQDQLTVAPSQLALDDNAFLMPNIPTSTAQPARTSGDAFFAPSTPQFFSQDAQLQGASTPEPVAAGSAATAEGYAAGIEYPEFDLVNAAGCDFDRFLAGMGLQFDEHLSRELGLDL